MPDAKELWLASADQFQFPDLPFFLLLNFRGPQGSFFLFQPKQFEIWIFIQKLVRTLQTSWG
jgi:hypothetical protein